MRYIIPLLSLALIFCLLIAGCTGSSNREGKTDLENTFLDAMEAHHAERHVDSFDLEYVDVTKHVNVYLIKKRATDGEHFRNSMAWASFSTMEALTEYSDEIDSVTIVGKTLLVSKNGDESLSKAYQADTSMKNARSVNWPNLTNMQDLTVAIKNNFDNVWWHPAVTG